jgi:hypothetical protein
MDFDPNDSKPKHHILKPPTGITRMFDNAALKVRRHGPNQVHFMIEEHGQEKASMMLTDERTKYIIIALCEICGVAYNKQDAQ